jgi:hypothetical protein
MFQRCWCCANQAAPSEKQGVRHTVALPFTFKSIKANEELWNLKYFTMQKYNRYKNL